jgi:hypothetical protein
MITATLSVPNSIRARLSPPIETSTIKTVKVYLPNLKSGCIIEYKYTKLAGLVVFPFLAAAG